MIRILVVDDHPVVREGLVAILSTQADFSVVGEASAGLQAVELCQQLQPDLVLLDLELPDLDGVAVLERLDLAATNRRVLVFTAFDTDERIIGAVRAGAQGYLLKGAPRDELFAAIRLIHAGGSTLHPLIASKLLRQVQRDTTLVELTPREHEVLQHLAQGFANKQIAYQLNITERTVKFHLNSIFQKLGAHNRTEAVAIAYERQLI
ncbi:MAG TPA: DNA-binding response regulator [Herpetosiphon sp.]|uniref:Two component transcriptional regulator, LuxR family n=1 Tax=Herpetosiphon aurantiacus (strain ATCC 23779 / DSM 785 / 114-95) TaxID=316274 RepID=A9B2B2_HERA2|nr:response regulator transcription factor [Herpetosiphon sp.]ABX03957.1 two component transcriptional regulator, LuxR family [Herpetosiphon aurantiacus DSM 785]HBW51043.1 DNA-binding response regulator [Herpetosiphon sp.]